MGCDDNDEAGTQARRHARTNILISTRAGMLTNLTTAPPLSNRFHFTSYDLRIGAAAALMAGSFLTVALGASLGVQLFGVGLCSLQAGTERGEALLGWLGWGFAASFHGVPQILCTCIGPSTIPPIQQASGRRACWG